MEGRLRRELLIVLVLVVVSLGLRLTFALRTDILQDEALYWRVAVEQVSFSPHPPVAHTGATLPDRDILLFTGFLRYVRRHCIGGDFSRRWC